MGGKSLTALLEALAALMFFTNTGSPIFFSQYRVGKNGRKFKIYKFRSMYMDAEERKKELMKQNRVSAALSFECE